MKTKILLPFLTILVAVFTFSFISKTDETLFKEYLKGFSVAQMPLKVQTTDYIFNEKNEIDKKFSTFFSREMKAPQLARMPVMVKNEFLQTVAQNENMIAVIVGVSKQTNYAAKKIRAGTSSGNYNKVLVIYDSKGNILDSKTLAYKYDNEIVLSEIKADLSIELKRFTRENQEVKNLTLQGTKNLQITASGKIVDTNKKDKEEQTQKQERL